MELLVITMSIYNLKSPKNQTFRKRFKTFSSHLKPVVTSKTIFLKKDSYFCITVFALQVKSDHFELGETNLIYWSTGKTA